MKSLETSVAQSHGDTKNITLADADLIFDDVDLNYQKHAQGTICLRFNFGQFQHQKSVVLLFLAKS